MPEYDLPELDPDEYMPGLFRQLRATRLKGFDAQGNPISVPTDWDIIAPFGDAMGLDAEDMRILSEMCRTYYEETHVGTNPLAIAPVERVNSQHT